MCAFVSDAKKAIILFNSVLNKVSNTSKEVKNASRTCLDQLMSIIEDQARIIAEKATTSLDTCSITTKLDSIEKQNNTLMKEINIINSNFCQKSYSSALKNGLQSSQVPNSGQKQSYSVVIRPNNIGNNTSKGTETTLKSIVNKTNSIICIKNVKYISNAGVIIDCDTQEDKNKLFETIANSATDYTAETPHMKWPKIAVFNVSRDIDENNIIEEIVANNREIKSFLEANNEDKDSHLKCKFKLRRGNTQASQTSSPKGDTWIIEVSPKLFKILCTMRSLLMAWRSCRFKEHIDLRRCFKCCAFGHIAANCKSEVNYCGICANNHNTKDCPKNGQQKCINCQRHNQSKHAKRQLDICHTVFSSDCESLKRIKNIIHSKTQYV